MPYSVHMLHFIWHMNLHILNHGCVCAVKYIVEGLYSVDCKVTIREIANIFREEQYLCTLHIWIMNLSYFYYFYFLCSLYSEYRETNLYTLVVLNVCLDWHNSTNIELSKIIIYTVFHIISSLSLHHCYLFRGLFW